MVILSISENNIEKDKRALRFFESRRVDGLVIGPVYNTQGTLDQSAHYQTSLSTVMLLAIGKHSRRLGEHRPQPHVPACG